MSAANIDFEQIYACALKRFQGDAEALEAWLPQPKSVDELQALSDDRYLSRMSQRIFRAGLRHAVVDAKWPKFEAAFWGFVPEKMVLLTGEHFERLMNNRALIRHLPKMKSIPINAQMMLEVAQQHGSFGNFIASWPSSDIVGLWRFLQRNGAQLGGVSAASFLRMVGKDTFMLDHDMNAALMAQGVLIRPATSQKDRGHCQTVLNELSQRTGRPLCQLSMLLSMTVNTQAEP